MQFSEKDKKLGTFSREQVQAYLDSKEIDQEIPTNGDQLMVALAGVQGVLVFNPTENNRFELWQTA